MTPPPDPLREALAAIEHDQWMTWARSILSADDVTIGPEREARWRSYMVPYDRLDEATKQHDRAWADAVIAALATPEPEKAGALGALAAVLRMSEYADKGESWPDTIESARYIIETDGLATLVARLDAADAEENDDGD